MHKAKLLQAGIFFHIQLFAGAKSKKIKPTLFILVLKFDY